MEPFIGCYDCQIVTSGDCGKHGDRVIVTYGPPKPEPGGEPGRYLAWDEELAQKARECRGAGHSMGGIILCPHCVRAFADQEAHQRGREEGAREEMERAASKLCEYCRNDHDAKYDRFAPAVYSTDRKQWIHPHPNRGWPGWVCGASRIRALSLTETPEPRDPGTVPLDGSARSRQIAEHLTAPEPRSGEEQGEAWINALNDRLEEQAGGLDALGWLDPIAAPVVMEMLNDLRRDAHQRGREEGAREMRDRAAKAIDVINADTEHDCCDCIARTIRALPITPEAPEPPYRERIRMKDGTIGDRQPEDSKAPESPTAEEGKGNPLELSLATERAALLACREALRKVYVLPRPWMDGGVSWIEWNAAWTEIDAALAQADKLGK